MLYLNHNYNFYLLCFFLCITKVNSCLTIPFGEIFFQFISPRANIQTKTNFMFDKIKLFLLFSIVLVDSARFRRGKI